MWDYVVFKKQQPIIKKRTAANAKGTMMPTAGTKPGQGKNKQSYQEFFKKKYDDLGLEDEYDKAYRPIQKVNSIS